jgi:hypothetical protein
VSTSIYSLDCVFDVASLEIKKPNLKTLLHMVAIAIKAWNDPIRQGYSTVANNKTIHNFLNILDKVALYLNKKNHQLKIQVFKLSV